MQKLLFFSFLFLSFQLFSQIVDPFSIRYQNQQKGGITMLSNVSVSCTNCAATTSQIPPNGNGINNNFSMSYVDVDGISSTFMSSSDSLNLANCSEVLWAGLYWSARVAAGGNVNSTPNYGNRNQIKLRVNNGAYQILYADELLDNATGHQTYHCFKNITSIVQSNGIKARYTVADLVTRLGSSGMYGGWTIVVVYKNVYESMRNLTVFDGLANVSAGNTVIIPITGFVTPLVGPVSFELGVVSHDGDRGDQGDQLLFNGAGSYVNISDATHNANDMFNSTISTDGVLTPFRNPSFNNNLGYDASIFIPNNAGFNYIGNNTNSANIQITTGGETILTSVVTSVIDVFEPDLRATVYIDDLNGGQVNPGDILEYTVVGKNIGSDVSLNTFITDTLDPRTVYIPNSISISYGQNSGPKTDAFLDDQAEYDPVNRVVKARIGAGANATNGGSVLNSPTGADSTVLKFQVTVIDDCVMFQCDPSLEHKAYIFGTGNISGNAYNNDGLSDLYDAFGCPTIATDILTINVAPCPPPTISSNSSICVGDTIQLNFPFSVQATYAWSGPNGFSSSIHNPSISNATVNMSGTYVVTVTFPGLDCEIVDSITVTVNPPPTITLNSITHVNCFGAATGVISITPSVNGPFTTVWTNSSGAIVQPVGLVAGTYQVVVTNANSCSSTASYTVTQNPQINGSITPTTSYNGFNVSCFGAIDAGAIINVTGGNSSYSYVWNNGSVGNSVSNLNGGFVSVTVTDGLGCSRVFSTTLSQPPLLNVSLTSTNVQCFGDNDGSITATVSGGVAPYSYSWPGNTNQLTNLSNGLYSLLVTDNNGCSTGSSVEISGPLDQLTFSGNVFDVACQGENTGAIYISPFGGTTPWSFSWSNGAITQDLENVAAGTYSLTLTDNNGCTATNSFTINEPTTSISASFTTTAVACFGEATGAIDLSTSGGVGSLDYLWNNGATTQDLAGISSGNYSVTITDQNLCSISVSPISVTQPAAALTSIISKVDVDCFGNNSGEIDLTTTGGTAPYQFSWSNGETSADLTNLTSGTYSVLVIDNNGCSTNAATTINQPSLALNLSSVENNVLCFGGNSGAIDITPIGGTAPYTYTWSTGATSQDLSGLVAGNYSVTITDNNNCTVASSFQITEPASPIAMSFAATPVGCFGESTGSIDVTASGGTGNLTYVWNTGATTQDLISIPTGNYSVTVTDENNCTLSIPAIGVTQPLAPLQTSFTKTDIACFGAATGAIDLTTSGGTAPYTYLWSNGETSSDISNLISGNYSVTVTDENGCTTSNSINLTQPIAGINLTESHINMLCFGESTGSIDVTTSGGTSPYAFSWNSGQNTEDIAGISSGIYTLTVTDAQSCVETIQVEVEQPNQPLTATETHTDALCIGAQQGTIDLTVFGGTAPYVINWNNGSSNEDQIDLLAGIYEAQITDVNACATSISVEILDPSNTTVLSETHIDAACFSQAIGSIDLTVTGGTSPYNFDWSTGATTEDISNLFAGNYFVNVTDFNGCGEFLAIEITEPATAVSGSLTHTDVLCHGNNTGQIAASASGGVAPYTYLWSNGETTAQITQLIAGIYSIVISDANGCEFNLSEEINQPANPISITEQITNVDCFGNNSGAIDVSVTGGTPTYSYSWSNASSNQDLASILSGDYTITVTDNNNCISQKTITVSQPSAPLSDVSVSTAVGCFGESTGAVDVTISGGTTPYGYSWSTGGMTNEISSSPAGNYSLTVTDANGCTLVGNYTITQPAAPLSVVLSMTPVICFGEANGSTAAVVSGGTTPYSYAWNSGSTSNTAIDLIAGNYSLTITDQNGCQLTDAIEVTQPDALAIQLSAIDVLCFGQSTGSVTVDAIGGQGQYTYNWDNGATTSTVPNLPAGIYEITVTDENNCAFTSSIEVEQPNAPISFDFTLVDNVCFEGTTGSASVQISGGTAPYVSSWSNGSVALSISNLVSGDYVFETIDANNCFYSETVSITEPDQISVQDSIVSDVSCNDFSDGSINLTTIGGTAPYQYAWSSGQTSEDVANLIAGNYSVTITDANGCTRDFSFQITQPDTIEANYTFIEPSCFGYTDGSISTIVSGGTSPYSYAWSNGATTQDNVAITAGNYDLTITDNNGCIFVLNTVLTQPLQIQVTFDANYLEGCDPLDVKLTNTSEEQFQSTWDFGDGETAIGSQVDHVFTGAGCYDITLEVTDANGCFNSATYSDFICVLVTPVAEIGVSNIELGVAYPETTITNLSISADSYSWNMGDNSVDYDFFEPGDYIFPTYNNDFYLVTLVAYNDNGCVDSTEVLIKYDNSLIMYVPNTFTPNGDEFNQVFKPVLPANVSNFNMKIYNRWGQLIFESFEFDLGWDGTFNGNLVQDGAYTWDIFVITHDAYTYKKQGIVNVLR